MNVINNLTIIFFLIYLIIDVLKFTMHQNFIETIVIIFFLKWCCTMHSFHCKGSAVTATYFKRRPYIMMKGNKRQCQQVSKHKRLPHSFYFLKVKCICIHLFIFISCYRFVETIFKMTLNTLITKYTDILIFNICTYHLFSAVHNVTLYLYNLLCIRFL